MHIKYQGNSVRCVGNAAQHETFKVTCEDPHYNATMQGRMAGGRAFTTWAQVVQQAVEQAANPVVEIEAMEVES